jgi:truncated hemoglobin YjbI
MPGTFSCVIHARRTREAITRALRHFCQKKVSKTLWSPSPTIEQSKRNLLHYIPQSLRKMSKQELQDRALKAGGVSYEESLKATNEMAPSMYERMGKEQGCEELSRLFYNRVFDDTEARWFLHIFSSSTKKEAIDNQYRFFVQTFGGPELYRQKKGKYTRLVGRHANYTIGHRAADHWVQHMKLAMEDHSHLKDDQEAKDALHLYFQYTAHYIVAASDYMRPDQVSVFIRVCKSEPTIPHSLFFPDMKLSGGTKMDEGRIW